MRRRIVTLMIAFLSLPAMLLADSFTSLWKQVNEAEQKDQPRTELNILKKIVKKATSERSYGHLLKAQMMSMGMEIRLSPDSLASSVLALEALERDASASDVVLADIYRSVLGYVYDNVYNDVDSAAEKSRDYYKRSLEQPDALAEAFATNYEPTIIDGIDSRVFGDDLLHVLGFAAGEYGFLHDYYLANGNRAAACICAVQLLRDKKDKGTLLMQKSKYLQSVDSLINVYSDLPEAGELAIERYDFMADSEDATAEEKVKYIDYALAQWGSWSRMNVLRNARRRLTLPSFQVSIGDEIAIPNTPRKVIVTSVCNINELTMTVRKIDINDHEEYNLNNSKTYAKVKKLISPTVLQTQTRRYIGQPEYKTSTDTMEVNGLPIGCYVVEFTTDNVSVPVERALLRVSNLFVVSEVLPQKNVRWAVLNATTGLPVPKANLHVVVKGIQGAPDEVQTLTCDDNGEVVTKDDERRSVYFYAYTKDDNVQPLRYSRGSFSYYNRKKEYEYADLYTDRNIYRPGQTVHVAGVVYNYNNGSHTSSVIANRKITLTLRNTNYEVVATRELTTDEYGTVSTDFALPTNGLTGRYTVRSNDYLNGIAVFSVEEYKRPTFNVEFAEIADKYQSGDTVTVKGTAKSFAGVAVQGARVAYTVVRRPSLYWRYYTYREGTTVVKKDTVYTADDGSFSLRVPVEMPETMDVSPRRYFVFDITASVTDAAGETRHGECSIPLSDRPTFFDCTIPERIECDSTKNIVFEYRNNAGKAIDGNVVYYIDDAKYECKANTTVPLSFRNMASKKYQITAICGTDTIKKDIVAFSLNDKKAVVETHDWFYQSAEKFPQDGKVYIQVGSSDSVQHIVYTIFAGDSILENSRISLNGELYTREFKYQKAYGDGLKLTFAWVKEGQLYQHIVEIERPQEDKRLIMKWKTFRDRLTPGQKEEWILNITRPDGTAAKAQLLSTMYDKSLDEITKRSWKFNLSDYNNLPSARWNTCSRNRLSLYGEMPFRPFNSRGLVFSHIDETLLQQFNAVYGAFYTRGEVLRAKEVISQSDETLMVAGTFDVKGTGNSSAKSISANSKVTLAETVIPGTKGSLEDGLAGEEQLQMRENLNETAFFYPDLTTDEQGNVKLKFTLPESVTTWKFLGFAHDKDMNNGLLESETVAKKTVMIQPNVPRFVRSGDKGSLLARVMNTSDGTITGTARCELIDPETEKVVFKTEKKYTINGGENSTVAFEYDVSKIENTGLLICRVSAVGKGYSDGEQHYLPVLPDKELVTNTLPFSLNAKGTKTIDVKSLFAVQDKSNKLTIEYTSNPVWLMIQALPSLSTPQNDNAIDLATAYYVNSLGQNIMQSSPVIKQTVQLWQQEGAEGTSLQSSLEKNEELKSLILSETPWLLEADRESEQKRLLINYFDESAMQYRLNNALTKLKKLQNTDGSFSWWEGMSGSYYMTTTIVELLVRLNSMIGEQQDTQDLLTKAFQFLSKKVADEVKELKKEEKKGTKDLHPSELATVYLYACALDGRTLSSSQKADNEYMISLIEKHGKVLTIYGKACTAIIMSKNGRATKASELLQSIKEYTVYKDEMGRYFDSPKALYSWFDYRIPSQTMTIEALKMLTPDDKQTIEEMQRWLLQCKRTQQWSTPVNSTEAIYAFLGGNMKSLSATTAEQTTVKLDGKKVEMPKSTAGLGYMKTALTGDKMGSLSIEKQTDGTSWGAVYAQFMQPTTDVEASSAGLTVSRDVLKDGKVVGKDGAVDVKVGDKLTVRITIQADRDYDFVQVSDKRAACMEPVSQLSGYRYGYYCAPKDNMTNYFFDCLSKGKHVIETTYYVDREGTYHTGTVTVACSYSPEFAARGAAMVVNAAK